MKRFLKYVIVLTLLLLAAAGIDAMGQAPFPKKAEGFWVLESNVHTPKNAVVYFYNQQQVLVYKEEIRGIRLNTAKQSTIKLLNNVLQQALVVWNKDNVMQENRQLLASRL